MDKNYKLFYSEVKRLANEKRLFYPIGNILFSLWKNNYSIDEIIEHQCTKFPTLSRPDRKELKKEKYKNKENERVAVVSLKVEEKFFIYELENRSVFLEGLIVGIHEVIGQNATKIKINSKWGDREVELLKNEEMTLKNPTNSLEKIELKILKCSPKRTNFLVLMPDFLVLTKKVKEQVLWH